MGACARAPLRLRIGVRTAGSSSTGSTGSRRRSCTTSTSTPRPRGRSSTRSWPHTRSWASPGARGAWTPCTLRGLCALLSRCVDARERAPATSTHLSSPPPLLTCPRPSPPLVQPVHGQGRLPDPGVQSGCWTQSPRLLFHGRLSRTPERPHDQPHGHIPHGLLQWRAVQDRQVHLVRCGGQCVHCVGAPLAAL